MQQHATAKAAYPDCVVFFRLGDFYEMFGEDAVLVSEVLDLTLTSRNKGKVDEIPMAGVLHHAAHGYIARLLQRGFKVAVCEQMADPATVKGIVPREVVRVITPGTWTNESEQKPGENNWLCAIELSENGVGVALLDLSTAELMAASVADLTAALSEIGRAMPKEILLSPGLGAHEAASVLREICPSAQVRLDQELTASDVTTVLTQIDLSVSTLIERTAAARVLRFARDCYRGRLFPVWRVAHFNPSGLLGLDRSAQRHLELVESTVGDSSATLLSVLDRTKSPGGARLLRRRLLMPLTDLAPIRRRQDEVQALIEAAKIRGELQTHLTQLGDLERLSVKGSLREATPKDLGNIRRGLSAARAVHESLCSISDPASRDALNFGPGTDLVSDLCVRLKSALVERPPAMVKEGAVFLDGFDPELDRLRALCTTGSERLSILEEELRKSTGINTLRVKYTRVFGWYIEVSRSQSNKVPDNFRRKQTVAGGERYTIAALDDLADDVQNAEIRFRARELQLISELNEDLCNAAQRIHRLAAQLSAIDVAASLAQVAVEGDYCRPDVTDDESLELVDARHPVVEKLAAAGRFVPNDVSLDARGVHLWLISGPNMAGKSTFLRQVALIVILAQMGSYVPARRAKIGLFDRVLSRVGASDNLAGGESTFMVEMRETASILRDATSRSLVILDEVGRGTSTFDGLAIAWAVAEHLDEVIRCRALFATHYHELTTLAEASSTAENYSVSAREHEGDVVFLHRVTKGSASRSFGVAVAQLAGLPETVLARARAVLTQLESGEGAAFGHAERAVGVDSRAQLDLFSSPSRCGVGEDVLATLRELDPDRLTGIDALQLLHQLCLRLKKSG